MREQGHILFLDKGLTMELWTNEKDNGELETGLSIIFRPLFSPISLPSPLSPGLTFHIVLSARGGNEYQKRETIEKS